jgi:hypothetical protein
VRPFLPSMPGPLGTPVWNDIGSFGHHEFARSEYSASLANFPLLEAEVLSSVAPSPESPAPAVAALATLGLHGQRLSRQFQKTLNQLRELQLERLERQRKDLRDAASVFQFHKHKGLPYDPAEDGFVFSKTEIETFAQRTMRLNEAWKVENFTLLGFRTPRNPRVLYSVDAL